MVSPSSESTLIARATRFAEEGQATQAIEVLEQCLREYPSSAVAHYLSAAESAQTHQYERAVRHFEAALALQPALHEARLQFGLLLLTLGNPDACLSVLASFDTTTLHPALTAYATGLCLLAQEQLERASQSLRQGINLRHPNAALNGDMDMLANEIDRTLASQRETETTGTTQFLVRHYDSGL